jgi:hypothetical protein
VIPLHLEEDEGERKGAVVGPPAISAGAASSSGVSAEQAIAERDLLAREKERLEKENAGLASRLRAQQHKEDPAKGEASMCVICMERKCTELVTPCMHLCLCAECVEGFKKRYETCPMCQGKYESIRHVFAS